MHQRCRLGHDNRPLGIACLPPGLEAGVGRGELDFELLVGQFRELFQDLTSRGIETLVGHGHILRFDVIRVATDNVATIGR